MKSKEISVQDIVNTINTWSVQANSGHNDGYIVEHYSQKIEFLKSRIRRKKKINHILKNLSLHPLFNNSLRVN